MCFSRYSCACKLNFNEWFLEFENNQRFINPFIMLKLLNVHKIINSKINRLCFCIVIEGTLLNGISFPEIWYTFFTDNATDHHTCTVFVPRIILFINRTESCNHFILKP